MSSNWDKFAENSSTSYDVDETMVAADFEQLLLAPSSIGGHFLFNSEKNWESNDEWYNRDEYFSLNLIELAQSLTTIPFYERMNYSKDVFSPEEIESMEKHANFQRMKWVANSKTDEAALKKDVELAKSVCQFREILVDAIGIEKEAENDEDELDELLGMTGAKSSSLTDQCIKSSEATTSHHNITVSNEPQFPRHESIADSKDDIQKWLDDVLNG